MTIENVVVISDTHFGCQAGLCPLEGVGLDSGGRYMPNSVQRKVWGYWEAFWNKWVPFVTKKKPYSLVINGDALDGRHHADVSQFTQNLSAQVRLALDVLGPVVEKALASGGNYYHIRGTEAHVGPSAEAEEVLARSLGAKPDSVGRYARPELRIRVGGGLVQIMHHIGTTSSAAYESTAPMKELTDALMESARWGREPPDAIVRSHRHRLIKSEIPAAKNNAFCIVTPGWQAKTPFTWRIAGARQSTPQFGGICLKYGDEGVYVRHKVWTIEATPEEENDYVEPKNNNG